jgi:hypothetical protein
MKSIFIPVWLSGTLIGGFYDRVIIQKINSNYHLKIKQ